MKKRKIKGYFTGGDASAVGTLAASSAKDLIAASQYQFDPLNPAYKADIGGGLMKGASAGMALGP